MYYNYYTYTNWDCTQTLHNYMNINIHEIVQKYRFSALNRAEERSCGKQSIVQNNFVVNIILLSLSLCNRVCL